MLELHKNQYPSLKKWINELKEFQLDSIFETSVLGRSYLYVDQVKDFDILDQMITGKVSGTEEYKMTITSEKDSIWGTCTCKHDQKCKHLAALLLACIQQQTPE